MITRQSDDLCKRRTRLAVGALIIAASLALVTVFRSHVLVTQNTFFQRPPGSFSLYGADFMCFYAAARVASKNLVAVYDPAILDAEQASIAESVNAGNPHYNYVYPPFMTLLLLPLSYMSFGMAYYSWMALSYLITGCAVFLLMPNRFTWRQRIIGGAVLPLGLPFFSLNTLMAGQLSSLAIVIFAIVVRLHSFKHFYAGMALALGVYKPPLFVGYVVLAFMAREWRLIQGALVGTVAIIGLSIALTGDAPWLAFLNEASGYRYGGSLSDGRSLPAGKGMGLLSAAICLSGSTVLGWLAFLALFLVASMIHLRISRVTNDDGVAFEQASRITLTYLLSIQALNYDAALLLVPILLVGSIYLACKASAQDLYLFVFSLCFLVVSGVIDSENGSGISVGCLAIITFWLTLIYLWTRHETKTAQTPPLP